MSATLIFLAGLLSAPVADMPFARRVQDHYPQWALRDEQQTGAAIELVVLPDGKVADCKVIESTGNSRLADEACAGTVGLKLKPATDQEGNRAYGFLRTELTLTLRKSGIETLSRLVAAPDVELAVTQLPESADHLDLEVALQISPEGSVEHCAAREVPSKPAPAAYFAAACEQARSWRGQVVRETSGMPVRYVTNLRVRFARAPALPEG